VWELDGPTPILKISKTLVFTKGTLELTRVEAVKTIVVGWGSQAESPRGIDNSSGPFAKSGAGDNNIRPKDSAFLGGNGKEFRHVLVNMARATTGAGYATFFVLSEGKNYFEGLLTVFAEEFIAGHRTPPGRISIRILHPPGWA